MNSELINLAQLTLTAKHYIRTGEYRQALTQNDKIDRFLFRFAALDFADDAPALDVGTREEWLEELSRRGAEDFKFIMPDEVDDYGRLGRLNSAPCCMICFYKNGVTSWNRFWSLNPESGKWVVMLIEKVISTPAADKPRFKDISQEMVKLLERIRALAQKLELSEFSFRFGVALKALQADFVSGAVMQPASRRLLQAAIEAFVFGGEDGWNEKGRLAAAGKGLSDDYEALTKDLYRGIALSMMYAVNEC